jgi:hypothetical protein
MIRYALVCTREHPFEAWFSTSGDYDAQVERGLVECPFCASRDIRKQIMAPAVTGTKAQTTSRPTVEGQQMVAMPDPSALAPTDVQSAMMEVMTRVRQYVETHFENVGTGFAREARDIHDGVSDDRAIYGQATAEEVRSLIEDGVPVAPLPIAVAPRAKLN